MSSETDRPRQRTVAELLAEHGGGGAPGRRRRRRENAEGAGHDESAFVNGGVPPETGLASPDRSVLREPVPPAPAAPSPVPAAPAAPDPVPPAPAPLPRRADGPRPTGPGRSRVERGDFEQRGAPESSGPRPLVSPTARVTEAPPVRPPDAPPPARARPAFDSSTEKMPRLRRDGSAMLDPGLTAPIEHQKPAVDDSPRVGLAPAGSEEERRRERPARSATSTRSARRVADDGGPPTQASAAPVDLDDDPPAGLGTRGLRDTAEPDADIAPVRARRGKSPGQAWAGVVAQWILGAVGGAALWVGFRYLWQELRVVAVAAAVLVTIGLVMVVRHLLRNDDRRTTVFAILVGLLLTVSPALLVLMHRT